MLADLSGSTYVQQCLNGNANILKMLNVQSTVEAGGNVLVFLTKKRGHVLNVPTPITQCG